MASTDAPSERLRVTKLRLLDWLLGAVPMAFVIHFVPAWNNDSLLFLISSVGLVPLAVWMSRATENLGERTGSSIGGLLNATFGNAPEFIFALVALSKGLVWIVKASIIGSILGNILLVLGISILAGGLRFKQLRFNQTGTSVAATSLSLATIGLIIPTLFHTSVIHQPESLTMHAEQTLSIAIAVVLLLTYVFWLYFSLVTHPELFSEHHSEKIQSSEGQKPAWSILKAILILAITAVLIAVLSDFISDSVETVCKALGLTQVFVGIIIVAIIGNAGESTAILVALKNRINLCLSITIGSSLQVALFVTPLLVLISQLFGKPMTLEFSIPEITAMVMAVGTVVLISRDGECNWVEGVQLLSVYVIIAILFFFLPEPV